MRFKIDRASLIVGSKFNVFALFYLVFEGNFLSTSPREAYIWRGNLTEGFLRYLFGWLIFEWAQTRRGLFSEFYGTFSPKSKCVGPPAFRLSCNPTLSSDSHKRPPPVSDH